jgi:adenosine deaminase
VGRGAAAIGNDELGRWIARLPKAELHVHLEGAVRPRTLLALAARNGVVLPWADEAGLGAAFRFRDFAQFFALYDLIGDCVHTPDDLALLVYDLGAAAAADSVRYVEVTTTTLARVRRGLALDDQLAGLDAGARRVAEEFGVRLRFIPDLIPGHSLDEAWQLVRWAADRQDRGICALGLGGSETGRDARALAPLFAYARDAGLPRAPHAGETGGPAQVWDALTLLHADRIGHGVRAVEDPALVETLRARRAPLEVCPTSNVLLGIAPSPEAHPIRRLWDAGLCVTVNTDDPALFGVTLSDEYRALAAVHGFTRDELRALARNAFRAAFLPAGEKAALLAEFEAAAALETEPDPA